MSQLPSQSNMKIQTSRHTWPWKPSPASETKKVRKVLGSCRMGDDGDEHHEVDGYGGERPDVVKERPKQEDFEVFVGGLDRDATEVDLVKVFSMVGEITDVRLPRDPTTQKNKGFAFLRFATVEQARRAVNDLKHPVIIREQCGVAPNQGGDLLPYMVQSVTPSQGTVQTPRASAKVLIPVKGKETETESVSGKSGSSTAGDVLGLAIYASDDDDNVGDDDEDKEQDIKSGRKANESESRKKSTHSDVKGDRKEIERLHRVSAGEDLNKKRERTKDEYHRLRHRLATDSSRHKSTENSVIPMVQVMKLQMILKGNYTQQNKVYYHHLSGLGQVIMLGWGVVHA